MRRRLGIFFLFGFIGPFGGNAVFAIIDPIRLDLHAPVVVVALSVTAFMVPFAASQLLTGSVAERQGRVRTITYGVTIYAFASLMCALAVDISSFMLGRVLQGLGFGFVLPPVMAFLGAQAPEHHRGTVMGVYSAAITAGTTTGPLVAGFFGTNWRGVFLLIAGLAFGINIVFIILYKDRPGSATVHNGDRPRSLPLRSYRTMLQRSDISILNISAFLVFLSWIGVISYFQPYAKEIYGILEHEAGIIISAAGFAGLVISIPAGLMIDRVGRHAVTAVGLLMMTVGIALVRFAGSFTTFIPVFLLIGAGSAMIWAALSTLAIELVPEHRDVTAALFNAFRFFGYAAAPAVFSFIYLGNGLTGVANLSIVCLLATLAIFLAGMGRREWEP